jgi:hypothetical protein
VEALPPPVAAQPGARENATAPLRIPVTGHRARPVSGAEGWLIAGPAIAIAAFNAGLLAARERVVWTDPGSLCAARVARIRGRRQSGRDIDDRLPLRCARTLRMV